MQACFHIFRQNTEEMLLKIEAFCVVGLGGTHSLLIVDCESLICLAAAISATTGLKNSTVLRHRRLIREKISMGLIKYVV